MLTPSGVQLRGVGLLSALCCVLVASGAASAGWTLVPLTGYGSTRGFAYGLMIAGERRMGLDAVSLQLYRTTKNHEVVEIGILKTGLGGLTSVTVGRRRTPSARFYGYGNGGDGETWAEYTEESDRLDLFHARNIGGGFSGGVGLDVRHAVTYDREASPLWQTLPGGRFSSEWSVGPRASITFGRPSGAPFPGYVRGDAVYQFGGSGGYGRVTCRAAGFVTPPVRGAVLGAHVALGRHFGIENTPFSWRPTLGGGDDLRGYPDRRFTGRWLLWSNVEFRQRILTLSEDPGAYVRGVGVVLFGDAGQVAEEIVHFGWSRFRLCAGLGLRIYMSDNVTVRADFAKSPEGLGIVLTFGEVF